LPFGVRGSRTLDGTNVAGPPVGRGPAPIVGQQIIAPRGFGTIKMIGGIGGFLLRFQDVHPGFAHAHIARLRNAKVPKDDFEDVDVVADPELFTYDGFDCGETFFQWFKSSDANPKRSGVVRALVLVRVATTAPEPLHPPVPGVAGVLLSVEDTPLNPLAGRRINLFGRGESNGFEDYSSDLPFCTDRANEHRPWTDDPRKPQVGIPDRSIQNICLRGSPVKDPTIREIKRIANSGCRVTISGHPQFTTNVIRKEFIDTRLAKTLIFDAPSPRTNGHHVIIFELA
jgi:hypothetical protein